MGRLEIGRDIPTATIPGTFILPSVEVVIPLAFSFVRSPVSTYASVATLVVPSP